MLDAEPRPGATGRPGVYECRQAILLVSPAPEDHAFLRPLLSTAGRKAYFTRTYREAVGVLCRDRISVIICERDLPDGKWKDLLSQIAPLSDPPCLIVASRLADEFLWAEVLNLGGYDVLAKPFDAEEVARVVALACESWEREYSRRQESAGWQKPPAREQTTVRVFKSGAGG